MSNTCAICQCDIEEEHLGYLPCAHSFHTKCCLEYMERKLVTSSDIECPVCRVVHFRHGTADYNYIAAAIAPTDAVQSGNSSQSSFIVNTVTTSPQTGRDGVVINIPGELIPTSNTASKHSKFMKVRKTHIVVFVLVFIICMTLLLMVMLLLII